MRQAASIALALVYPRGEGRPVVPAHVAALKDSLSAIGLQSPITVTACEKYRSGQPAAAYEIVTGRHRYEAAVALNWTEIDAFVMEGVPDDIELWEIDENFARAELTDAQRADHHARRERILIAKGVVRPNGRPNSANSAKLSYADQAASSLGVSRRTVAQELARGKKIDPDVLKGADDLNGSQLDELARTPREDQAAKAAEIRERQESEKLNRYADKAVARSSAEEAAEIVHANLDLVQVDALVARLASVTMKDFLAALSMARAG